MSTVHRTFSPMKFGANSWNKNSPVTNRMACLFFLRQDDLTAGSQLQPSSFYRGIAARQNKRCSEDTSIPFAFPGSVLRRMLKGCLQEGKTTSAVQGAFTENTGLWTWCSILGQLYQIQQTAAFELGVRNTISLPPAFSPEVNSVKKMKDGPNRCKSVQRTPFCTEVTRTRCPLNPILWDILCY